MLLIVLLLALSAKASSASLPIEYENQFAAISALIQSKRLDAASDRIERLIEEAGKFPEVLELQALILGAQGSMAEAMKIYEQLIELRASDGVVAVAPYHYELAVAAFKKEEFSSAQAHFIESIKGRFNTDCSNLYLGRIRLREGNFEQARDHFANALETQSPEILLPARLYLAHSETKLNNRLAAQRNYAAAFDITTAILSDGGAEPSTQKLATDALKQMKQLSAGTVGSTVVSNVGIYGTYD